MFIDACCGITDVLCACYHDPEDELVAEEREQEARRAASAGEGGGVTDSLVPNRYA